MSQNEEEVILTCPNCKDYFIMKKLNCGIFRHGALIISGEQINPHASKESCEYFLNKKLIYGCGKPFRVILINDKFVTEICDYI
jgi:hypothetical protein